MDLTFSITPTALLNQLGWKFKKRGQWLTVKECPVCGGGESKDKDTFAIHEKDGNFFCLRGKCGIRGGFWKFLEACELDPKDYINKDGKFKRTKKKKYIYGK